MADGGVPFVWSPTARDRLRARAQNDVTAAIKRGLLLPPETRDCVDCGEQAECYDHRNYYAPLTVVPVCQGCNIRRGPGHPLPSELDCNEYRNDLKAKGKHIKAAVGARWQMDEGEGWTPRILPVHAVLNWRDLESTEDEWFDVQRNQGSFRKHTSDQTNHRLRWHNGGRRGGWSQPVAIARYEYFKAHDPWRLT
jgi:hypothetical protein